MPKSKHVKAECGFIKRKDLMQGMKALIGLKVRAITRRRPCTERRPPRRGGSGAVSVTVRLAVRVERSAPSKEAVGTSLADAGSRAASSAVSKALSAARHMGAGAGWSQSTLLST